MAARTEAPAAALLKTRTPVRQLSSTAITQRSPHGFVSFVAKDNSLDVIAQNGSIHRFSVRLQNGARTTDALTPLFYALGKIDPHTHWVTFGAAGLNGEGRDFAAETWLKRGISTMLFEEGSDIDPQKILSEVQKKHSPFGIRQVDIDSDGRVHSSRLARWTDYRLVTRPEVWNENIRIIENSIRALNNTVVIDDNTSAQAGGVAGMNHPKQRFAQDFIATEGARITDGDPEKAFEYQWFKRNGEIDPVIAQRHGVDLHDPELLAKFGDVDPADPQKKKKINIFKLTKLRHNIMQNVADPAERYTEKDNNLYLAWSETQYEKNLKPVLEKIQARGRDVVLKLEDQQTWGMLRYIRKDFPDTDFLKIILRNHIHSHAELARDPSTQQHVVANYILDDLDHHMDLFMSHRSVDRNMGEFLFRDAEGNIDSRIADKIVYAVASFDDLDGLGKPITDSEKPFLHAETNHYLVESGQEPSDFNKPALGESNRWDPSKRKIAGILAYAKFVQMMEKQAGVAFEDIPEYRSVGMGANDDPDGERLFAAYMLGLHPELAARAEYRKYLDSDREDYEAFKNSDINAIKTLFKLTDADPRLADKIKLFRFTYDKYDDRHRRTVEESYETARVLSVAEACEDNISRFINDGTFVSVPRVGGMAAQVEQGVSGQLLEMTNDDREFQAIANADFYYFTQIYPDPVERAKFRQKVKSALKPEYTTVYNVARELGAAALVKQHNDMIPAMIRQHLAATGEYPFVHDLLNTYKQKPDSNPSAEQVIFAAPN
jgi:hypothetical protein